MNSKQWFAWGVGMFALSMLMFLFAFGWSGCSRDVVCAIARYSYAIPAIVSFFISIICMACASRED